MAKVNIPTVNEKLLERYIRHSVYLEQLKKGEASLISRFLGQKIFPKLQEKLVAELSRVKNLETLGSIRKIPAKRLTRMLLAVRKISQAGAVKAEKMLVKRLVNISRFEAQWNKNIIEKTVPFDLDMTMPSSEVLRNLITMRPFDGHKLGTWLSGYSTAVRVAMTKQIKIGVASGESLPTIGARINKALNWKGKQAQYIARTVVSNVVHQAREEVFKKNKDIVRKVQWVATLDDRTSLICINYDGKMFDVGYGERPPAHFNCRSTVIPVTPSWQEYGIVDPPAATRASMNGAVPAKLNYRQWLKKQPKAVQVKVLGKKKAELYRSGQVKIDRFVGKDMRPLTLKQLARREGLDLRPAPPIQVKAMSTKGTGIKFTPSEIKIIDDWSFQGNHNMVNAQLGKPMDKGWILSNKQDAMKSVRGLEKTLTKLDGHEGTVYRGLSFKNDITRQKYLSSLKVGGIWENKAFMAASAKRSIAVKFSEPLTKIQRSVIVEIKSKSGRLIAKFSPKPKEMEVLFTKGTPFKVNKIVGNKVYLTEITKQAQLRPAPPVTITKVGTTFAKTTTKDIQDLITKQIDSYPEKVKAALNKSGTTYNIGNSLTEINPALKGKHPVSWSRGATWDNVGGMYNMNTKSVSIAETYLPRGQKFYSVHSNNQIRRTLNHETGHAFDSSDITGMIYSNQHKFKAAYTKDVNALSRTTRIIDNNLQFFMQPGGIGRSEVFADVFGDIMGGGAKPGISKFFPNTTKYIEGLLK